jgi:hypothetical protein
MITSMLKDIAKLVTRLLIVEPLVKSIQGMSFFGGGGAAPAAAGFAIPVPPAVAPLSAPSAAAFSTGGFAPTQLSGGGQPRTPLSVKSGVEVNVYNRADVEVSTKESQGADGQQVIDMYIDKRVNQRFSDGSLDKMLRANYGIMRNAGG